MNTSKFMSIILALAVFMGCGSKNNIPPLVQDLSSYSTYAFLPNTNPVIENMDYNDPGINKTIIDAVIQHMNEAGFQLDLENPDLLILLSTSTNTKNSSSTAPGIAMYPYSQEMTTVSTFYEPYYYHGYYDINQITDYDTHTFQYDEGTLVINLVDRVSQETVWKGIASQNIYAKVSTSTQREVVNSIFDEFSLRDKKTSF